MKPYVVLTKQLGKTPLECIEAYRASDPSLEDTPLAYAGRLDPMAEGKLIVLQGDECKVQEKYHAFDKEYVFEILFGASSDTADVLGITALCDIRPISTAALTVALRRFEGEITLPYPHFSSKTVQGKPLHMWKLEGKIDQIDIPLKHSRVYQLRLERIYTMNAKSLLDSICAKIATVTVVTDPKKALGKDFRRAEVLAGWHAHLDSLGDDTHFTIARIRCSASSGTYMRTLAEMIAKEVGTCGLAYSITRTRIGSYQRLPFGFGYWKHEL